MKGREIEAVSAWGIMKKCNELSACSLLNNKGGNSHYHGPSFSLKCFSKNSIGVCVLESQNQFWEIGGLHCISVEPVRSAVLFKMANPASSHFGN